MSKKEIKYTVSNREAEILPNKLQLKTQAEVEQAELKGFLYAYTVLFDELSEKTKFNLISHRGFHSIHFHKKV